MRRREGEEGGGGGGGDEFLSILIINIFYKIPVFYIKVDKNLCIITKRVCNNTMN